MLAVAIVAFRRWLAAPANRTRFHRLLAESRLTARYVTRVNSAQFTGTLATLVQSKVPLVEALAAASAATPNLHIRRSVEAATLRVREGASLRDAMSAARVFPPMLIAMIASGEAGGNLGETLSRAAEDQQRDLDAWVRTLVALVEPAILLVMGGLVMMMVLAASRRRFAVEELIAEPLEASHVGWGGGLGRGEYLVVVVAHREMAVWAGRAAPGQRLVPDVLALPVPADGCCSVREAGGRVLVRRADGTGYATRAEYLEGFWRARTARRRSCSMADGCPSRCRSAPLACCPRGRPWRRRASTCCRAAHARAGRGGRRVLTRLLAVMVLALPARSGGRDRRGRADRRDRRGKRGA